MSEMFSCNSDRKFEGCCRTLMGIQENTFSRPKGQSRLKLISAVAAPIAAPTSTSLG